MNDIGENNDDDCQVVCAKNANEDHDCEAVGNTRGKQMMDDQDTQTSKKTKLAKCFRLLVDN